MLDIMVILDRSGSMMDARSDHEGGLRSFVDDQKNREGEIRFTLVQFDSQNPCDVVYDRVSLEDVKNIELIPRGGTPLLDAMGGAFDLLLKHKPEEVICMVITDGHENDSKEWTRDRIKNRVAELEKQNWTFLFLGANIDAFSEAHSLGIAMAASAGFANNAGGVRAAYGATGQNVNSYRTSRARGASYAASVSSLNFTDSQRSDMSGDGGTTITSTTDATSTTGTTTDKEKEP